MAEVNDSCHDNWKLHRVHDLIGVGRPPRDLQWPGNSRYREDPFLGDELTSPMCRSTVWIRRLAPGTKSFECTSFSTANTIPSFTRRPIAVLY
jgi:hypothetical protein